MKKALLLSFAAIFLFVQDGFCKDKEPLKIYVRKNACPFELCTFGTWSVLKDTVLYAEPYSREVVGKVFKGKNVDVPTGETHTWPAVIKVTRDYTTKCCGGAPVFTFRKGKKVYFVSYYSEGLWDVWYEGKIFTVGTALAYDLFDDKEVPPNLNWGKVVKYGKMDWWVKVQMKNGKFGWTKETDNFGNNSVRDRVQN